VDRDRGLPRVLVMDRADICFWEERNPRIAERDRCEIALFGHGHILRAVAAANDPAVAADRVVSKLRHRLEKLRGRLIARSGPRRRGSVHFVPYHHTPPFPDFDATADAPCRSGLARPGRPITGGLTAASTEPMTPEEAALEMAQLNDEFYFFLNTETGRRAVVYRRKDGYVGLIDITGAALLSGGGL
jgi:putative sigma-54 modulation protein